MKFQVLSGLNKLGERDLGTRADDQSCLAHLAKPCKIQKRRFSVQFGKIVPKRRKKKKKKKFDKFSPRRAC